MRQDDIDSIASRIASLWQDLLGQRRHSSAFLRQIDGHHAESGRYEQAELLEKALQTIPMHAIYEKAGEHSMDDDELGDWVARELMHWFKHEFFVWVNEAPCNQCGQLGTTSVGTAQPKTEERRYGASVVEQYMCRSCRVITRFPRYNDPAKLLETRRGRCGEWANCFTLCCRAMGLDARIVYDTTDHVWTEVYSTLENRWVHCDPCEDAYDRPHMYEAGWNKKLSFCIAYSAHQVVDVTRRYVVDWPSTLQRRRAVVDEESLAQHLSQLCATKLEALNATDRAMWQDRRHREQQELLQKVHIKPEEQIGRQSGSMAWRMLRGEQGRSTCAVPHQQSDQIFENIETEQLDITHTTCQGTARALSEYIELTRAEPSQCGGCFLGPLDLTHGFQLDFRFCMTNAQGGPATGGADGMAVLLQANPEPRLGQDGCELGYGGVRNSLAIEFDTYQSADRADDPSDNHISVHGRLPPLGNSAHHRYSLGHTSAIPPMNSGQWIYARVRYLATATLLAVYVKESPTDNFSNVLTATVDMDVYLSGKSSSCWLGFTAATGGLSQCHQVQILSLARHRAS